MLVVLLLLQLASKLHIDGAGATSLILGHDDDTATMGVGNDTVVGTSGKILLIWVLVMTQLLLVQVLRIYLVVMIPLTWEPI